MLDDTEVPLPLAAEDVLELDPAPPVVVEPPAVWDVPDAPPVLVGFWVWLPPLVPPLLSVAELVAEEGAAPEDGEEEPAALVLCV